MNLHWQTDWPKSVGKLDVIELQQSKVMITAVESWRDMHFFYVSYNKLISLNFSNWILRFTIASIISLKSIFLN